SCYAPSELFVWSFTPDDYRSRPPRSRMSAPTLLVPDAADFETDNTQPDDYIMKAAGEQVVYVGKAKNLRARLRQYFRPGDDTRYFVAAGLLARVLVEIETMIVDNEKEALLLENHLIMKHQPRFNIKLRDDK